jgi:hypothetical protein
MKLHLTYCSSEEGIKLIKLYKYLKHNTTDIEMTYFKSDYSVFSSLYDKPDPDGLRLIVFPANRIITGYDNIRIALKSIFPTLFDLTPIKRVPLLKKNRAKIIDMLP